MRRLIPWVALAGALVLAVSCKTTPPEQPPEQPAPEAPAPEVQPEAPKVAAPEAELAKAKELKEKIDQYGLADYLPAEYEAGVEHLKAGEAAYGKDNAAAKQSLDSAVEEFTAVIATGGAQLVGKFEEMSVTSKKAADEIKAPVAVKDDYAKALAVYEQAVKAKAAGDLEQAGLGFMEAQELFEAVYLKAFEKRQTALQALEETDQAFIDLETKAQEAEAGLASEGFAPGEGE